MGLAAIDSHGQKEHIEINQIPKFGVNQASFYWDTAITNIKSNREMYGHPGSGRCVQTGSMAIRTFGHFQMAVSCLLLGLFTPNFGILWNLVCTLWQCGSIVANPIIYTLVPSPSRFENRQWLCACWQQPLTIASDKRNCAEELREKLDSLFRADKTSSI